MSLCKILLVDPSLSLPCSIRGEELSKTFSPRNALLFVSMVGDGCTFFFLVEIVILVSGWRGHWKGGG